LDDKCCPTHIFSFAKDEIMGKKQDRIALIKKIKTAATSYKKELVGKRFMYVFDGRYIEVIYKSENFRHLTGVETYLSAKQFYTYAVRGILTDSQIWFDAKHPYDLCVKKVKHIEDVSNLAASECFMLEEIKTSTQGYKFGTTALEFTLCMNKEFDESGNEKGDCFVAQSLRDEDCFSKSNNAYVVTHIFSRQNDAKKYTDLLFMDKTANLSDLPESIRSLLNLHS
jgi:hypothetical protein